MPGSRPTLSSQLKSFYTGDAYTMYHGTSVQTARLIITNGFRQSPDGMLGPGVYVSRNQHKAQRYPLKAPPSDRVVLQLRVNTGRVKRIDKDNHPMQKSWNAAGYDTAWVPPNCGMQSVPSGLEEDCVFDPQRVVVTSIAKAPNPTILADAVTKTIKHYDETGSHEDRHRKGRPRDTSATEDKFIRVTSLRNCSPNKCFTEFK
uniref:Grass carp reovirus (GCRV)-induced gene 2p n=1 Tax=Salmo trutta TaxID=8032 RepID=A0A674DCX2_SALTR